MPYDACHQSFDHNSLLYEDFSSHTLSSSSLNLSHIPQVDGFTPSLLPQPVSTPYTPSHNLGAIRKYSYTLDKNKQLQRLGNDAKIDDFTITVSPIAHNVNIKCSAGFYSEVVLFSFSKVFIGYENETDGVKFKCSKIEGRVDGLGTNVTAKIIFELSYFNSYQTIGTVTIHLHHTTRKVQLQGSSIFHEF